MYAYFAPQKRRQNDNSTNIYRTYKLNCLAEKNYHTTDKNY